MPDSVSGPLVVSELPGVSGGTAFGATLEQLRACVRMGIRDDGMQFIPDGDIDFFLNEGYLDLTSRLRLYKKEFSGTTTSTGTIPFPADYIELTSLAIGTQSLQEATDVVFDSYRVPSGVPPITLYRFFGTNIETYPVQASTAYTIRYVARPPKLTVDSDIFMYLPAEMETRLCSYGRAQARWLMEEPEIADRYMEVYLRGLPDVPRAAHRWGNGPDQLTPQASYFDSET
jgi:hypothetical protein